MKKTVIVFLAAAMVFTFVGCGKQDVTKETQGSSETKYESALDVLNAVKAVYEESDLFAMYGGDQENAVMDAPGRFDISKTEELESALGLPTDQISGISDAASMVHMMNANTFTSAAYRLQDGQDMNAFADAVKTGIMDKQWVCGQPDTLLIIDVDGSYVITAYGDAELIETFQNNALSALDGAQVITEASIS